MGKRRIRNLLKLGYTNIVGFDTRKDRRNEVTKNYNIRTTQSIKKIIDEKPNLMVISTPPDLHLKYANIAIKNKIDFFMELNLLSRDVSKIIKQISKKPVIALPSATMYYHPIVKELKKLVDKKVIGKILTIHHHAGNFLPNWHPWENYKNFFVSKKKTGGAKEIMPIELSWLTYLFSEIESIYGNVSKVSKLDVDIDDVYQILLKFKNGIFCTMIIDVISIPSFRETKIIGEKGTILCDFNKGCIKINKGKGWKTLKIKMGRSPKKYKGTALSDTIYEDETRSFVNAIKHGKKYPLTLQDELKLLQILDGSESSSKKGKKVILN